MLPIAARLKPEQIRDVALYYASLVPTGNAK
jgi:cytochrome c553